MVAKPLKYSEKVAVSFSREQIDRLKETGDTVSGLLRRLALKYILEYDEK